MVEAFIAGTPAREIARWAHPRVAHNTISRYMRARVRPALNNAARLFAVDPPRTGAVLDGEAKKKTRDVATQQTERPQMERDQAEQLAMEALVAAPALSIFRARLEKLHDRVDRALRGDRTHASLQAGLRVPLGSASLGLRVVDCRIRITSGRRVVRAQSVQKRITRSSRRPRVDSWKRAAHRVRRLRLAPVSPQAKPKATNGSEPAQAILKRTYFQESIAFL
jgi:hypothetical protein